MRSKPSTPLLGRVACVPARAEPRKLIGAVTASKCRVVELRLDILGYSRSEALSIVEELSLRGLRVITTLRDRRDGGYYEGADDEKEALLLESLEKGAWMIDVEYGFSLLDIILRQARGKTIVSFHDFRWTPPPEVLYSYAGDMLRRGAGIAKIATMARGLEDNWRVLGINARWPGRVAAFAMGPKGRLSRVLAPLMGAALTYVALGEPVAPGQLSLEELLEAWRLLGVEV